MFGNRQTTYAGLISASKKSLRHFTDELRQWRPPGTFDTNLFLSTLSELNPSQHTLVFAQILTDALTTASSLEHVSMLDPELTRFIAEFDMEAFEQYTKGLDKLVSAIGRIGSQLRDIEAACVRLLSLTVALNEKMAAAVDTLGAQHNHRSLDGATEKLGSNSTKGVRPTKAHIDCLMYCLYTRNRELHVAVLENVIGTKFSALGTLAGTDKPKVFMLYHYYAGMVAVGAGNMERAIQLWKLVFAVSLQSLSAIQVAAYKRLLLISLLEHGTRPRLPSFFPNVHTRDIEAKAAAYVSLAEAFVEEPTLVVLQRLSSMRRQLEIDQNLSLANRVIEQLPAHQIRKVGDVYASLYLSQLADKIAFSSFQRVTGQDVVVALANYIQNMRDPGIQVQGDVVVFVPSTATVSTLPNSALAGSALDIESAWAEKIKSKVAETEQLRSRLTELDHHLALTEEYVTNSRD
ncbi:hypothetical protein FBU59_003287 [Linderina macrospora]|uniref:Uncharacterized protein n=1 Tax=Linderina macrospora TaxID=4868 RepID=A0ACC1J8Q2_9FUNG|nr:hypothetical protein FBU59_003287 [Linderina macrospora]